jgi:hypothetical protein
MDVDLHGIFQLFGVLEVYVVELPLLVVPVHLHHARIRPKLLFHTGCLLFCQKECKIGKKRGYCEDSQDVEDREFGDGAYIYYTCYNANVLLLLEKYIQQ